MHVEGELALVCVHEFCRSLETRLRGTLWLWRHIGADMVVEPVLDVPRVVTGLGFGMHVVDRRAALDPRDPVVGHIREEQLAGEADVEKSRDRAVESVLKDIGTVRCQPRRPWEWAQIARSVAPG